MNRELVRFIVKKYLRFDPSQPFISVTAVLAFLGVTVGVMVLLVAMAIMNGFDKEFKTKLSAMNYPLTIYSRTTTPINASLVKELSNKFPSLAQSPFVESSAIARYGETMDGVLVFGIDPDKERKVNAIFAKYAPSSLSHFGLIAGEKLLDNFMIHKDSKLTLIFSRMEPSGIGLAPTMKRFNVEGNFTSGLYAYDKAYIYTSLSSMQAIMGLAEDEYHGIHLYSDDPFSDIEKIKALLPKTLGIVGWWEQNGNFFSALALEKKALFIVLMLIILIASLNIVSSLLMTIMNRRKEIALLLSLGASQKEVHRIFFYLGTIIGAGGIIVGALLGLVAIFLLGQFDIISLPADVYGTTKLPLELSTLDFLLILFGSCFVVLFSSWYPAKKASTIDPLETLRNE